MFTSEILHLKGVDQTYMIDRKNKTYSEMKAPTSDKQPKAEPEVNVTKTSETAKVLSYTCTKYIVTYTENGHTITQNIWATTELKDIDLKSLSKQNFGKGQRINFDKIDGVPLKINMNMPEANMTMEVTDIKKETLDGADFTLPSDFKKI
jgi:hypothetical protein